MQVYADNAATTKVDKQVLDTMIESTQYYGNPSMVHSMGQKSKELIENARSQIASVINAKPQEIIFVSSGTEANNLAIQGYFNFNKGNHIITTSIEHMSVLNPIWHLYDKGCDITILPVDAEGNIDLRQLQNSIRINTALISVMFTNNEIGTIQPIEKIGKIARQCNVCFHTDAVSAFGYCDIDVDKLGIDMMSLSGHKIYAPKGIGVLYVKNNIDLLPLFHGSGQEYGLRSGTENFSGIVGMGKAVELLGETNTTYILALKNKLVDGITTKIPNVKFNGSVDNSLCNIVNLTFDEIDGDVLLSLLDEQGIYASNGSPYMYNRSKLSHVMTAIGVTNKPVRFSLGKYNTDEDIDYILDVLPELVNNLRSEQLR